MTDYDRELKRWLRRARWALGDLPPQVSDDIVTEAHSHIDECISRGQTVLEVLNQFGSPEDYAHGFVAEWQLATAAGSRDTGQMLRAVLPRVHRSLVALTAFLAVAVLATSTLAVVLVSVVKILDPVHAGLWRGDSQFFLGVIDKPATAHELLGNWLFPLAALSVVLAAMMGRFVLVWAVRRLARAR